MEEIKTLLHRCQFHVHRNELNRVREILSDRDVTTLAEVVAKIRAGDRAAYDLLSNFEGGRMPAHDVEATPLADTPELGADSRTRNCLESIDVFTIGDLMRCDDERILKIPNVGPNTIRKLQMMRNSYLPTGKKAPDGKKKFTRFSHHRS